MASCFKSRWYRFVIDNGAVDLLADQLVIGYRGTRSPTVVARTSFRIGAGMVVAVVGPNGVGKTTLLKTLLGLLPPLEGAITIGGLSPSRYRSSFGIGYLPESLTLPACWSGRGLLALTALAAGRGADADLPGALRIAGIDFSLARSTDALSKGMRQRLALAMTLIPLPRLLLLDEPEAGLDPAQRILLRERIREFAGAGRIVVLASHDVSALATIADDVYLLRNAGMSRIHASELLDPQRVVALFSDGET